MSVIGATIAGSSAANLLTAVVLMVMNCIRKRLNKSKCESHCYIFDCEAQLDDLKDVRSEVVTQRGMIQNLVEMLDPNGTVYKQYASSSETNPTTSTQGPQRAIETV
jgi:hypothetical protein